MFWPGVTAISDLLERQVWLGALPGLQETLLLRPWQGVAMRRAQLLKWLRPAKRRSSAPVLLPCTLLLPIAPGHSQQVPSSTETGTSVQHCPASMLSRRTGHLQRAAYSMKGRQGAASPA